MCLESLGSEPINVHDLINHNLLFKDSIVDDSPARPRFSSDTRRFPRRETGHD